MLLLIISKWSQDVWLTALTAMFGLVMGLYIVGAGIDFTVNFLTEATGGIIAAISAYLLIVCFMEAGYFIPESN